MSTRESNDRPAADATEPADSQQPSGAERERASVVEGRRRTVHESDLFPPTAGPHYFGTGSYEMGGSHSEGGDAIGDLNPLGGYGSFTDAGGPGSATLYGEELPLVPAASSADAQGDAQESSQASVAAENKSK